MKNLTIVLEDRPGALAAACDAIGHAGVNIEGMCCFSSQGIAIVYVAVEDGTKARNALVQVGVKVSEERDMAVTPVEDTPGAAASILRRVADAGINVELAYLCSGPRLVIGTVDVEKVRAILPRAARSR